MPDTISYAPMTGPLLLWRCLHGGALWAENVDRPTPDARMPWEAFRARNLPLLEKLTRTYGACAMLAWEGERVVGMLRFYPKAVATLPAAGMLCLQQEYPAGPSDTLAEQVFPRVEALGDRTLAVHCLMVGAPSREANAYQRRGIGTGLARALAAWAGERGWAAIEATAYADLPIVYAYTGQAGVAFWERLGYRVVETEVEPAFQEASQGELSGFLRTMRQEAEERGVDPETVALRHTMRRELE